MQDLLRMTSEQKQNQFDTSEIQKLPLADAQRATATKARVHPRKDGEPVSPLQRRRGAALTAAVAKRAIRLPIYYPVLRRGKHGEGRQRGEGAKIPERGRADAGRAGKRRPPNARSGPRPNNAFSCSSPRSFPRRRRTSRSTGSQRTSLRGFRRRRILRPQGRKNWNRTSKAAVMQEQGEKHRGRGQDARRQFGSEVPNDMDALMQLPGVGRQDRERGPRAFPGGRHRGGHARVPRGQQARPRRREGRASYGT